MLVTRDNYSQYSNMIQQVLGGTGGSPDPYGTDYGNYNLRFTPTNRPFIKPDWNEIPTKQDKPAMSEAEFNEAIKELARKEFSSDDKDHKAIQKLIRQYYSVASPDRKAIYEDSMRRTGGKMNAACMFWDNNGNKTLSYHPITGRWDIMATEAESARARQFYSIYNDELKRLKNEYGESARGLITMKQIHDDLKADTANETQMGIGGSIDYLA